MVAMSEIPSAEALDSSTAAQWPELFSQHLIILKEHLNLWTSVKGQQLVGSKGHDVAQDCVRRTQEMLDNFDRLSGTFDFSHEKQTSTADIVTTHDPAQEKSKASNSKSTHRDEKLSLRPSKRRRAEDDGPILSSTTPKTDNTDHSEWFTIDPNPTPVDHLLFNTADRSDLARSAKRTKRSQHDSVHPRVVLGELPREQDELSIPTSATNLKVKGGTSAGTTVAGEHPIALTDEEAFLAKVNRKVREKEENRKKKSNKKRKRESQTSVDATDVQQHSKTEKRDKKKLKQDKSVRFADGKDSAEAKHGQKRAASAGGERSKRSRKD